MLQTIRVCLLSAALVAGSGLLNAQYGPPGGPYRPEGVSGTIQKIHADLNAGYHSWHLSHGDMDRLRGAERHLHEFASRWRHGDFDKGKLDDAIASIQHVIDNNHLQGPERDNLWQDVSTLRQMREAYDRHEIGRW